MLAGGRLPARGFKDRCPRDRRTKHKTKQRNVTERNGQIEAHSQSQRCSYPWFSRRHSGEIMHLLQERPRCIQQFIQRKEEFTTELKDWSGALEKHEEGRNKGEKAHLYTGEMNKKKQR